MIKSALFTAAGLFYLAFTDKILTHFNVILVPIPYPKRSVHITNKLLLKVRAERPIDLRTLASDKIVYSYVDLFM